MVTSLMFATVPEPRATGFELCWPATAAAFVAVWQDWAPDAPDDVTANLSVVAEHGLPTRVVVFGAALRDAEQANGLLDELITAAGSQPARLLRGGVAFRDLKRSFAEPDTGAAATRVTSTRSEFFSRTMPPTAIGALLDGLHATPASGRRELNWTAMGGRYNRVSEDETAFVHRGERFLLEHVADNDQQWVDRSWAIAHEHGSGRVYPNFPDLRLDDSASAYYGGNHARLVAVKRAYDPDRFFRFPQAV